MTAHAEVQAALAGLEAALPALRPQLHRYCARMTGSVIDGEDVLQETLLNASRAMRKGAAVEDLRAWLFRIAHNTALNFLRSRKSETVMKEQLRREPPPFDPMPMRSDMADTLRPFLELTPKQRSSVILRDVLGYTAAEVADLTDTSVQSVKSALHRGRTTLREYQGKPTEAPAELPEAERERLAVYVEHFNAHAFDELRDMLSAEVRLELVSRVRQEGKEDVGNYYSNYQKRLDWVMAPGRVEGRPAMLAFDRNDPSGPPAYFVLLTFDGDVVLAIRDFRYARYAMADASWERV